jgi:acyl-CoA dehydrogenase
VIDFELGQELETLRDRVRDFVREVAIPAEARDRSEHGLELDLRGAAVILEEGGYSVLVPQALNCAAPGEGNMHMLGLNATPEQRARYLVPLAASEIRSCFSMTEPAPGAGSDPSMLQTSAERIDGAWSISGRK